MRKLALLLPALVLAGCVSPVRVETVSVAPVSSNSEVPIRTYICKTEYFEAGKNRALANVIITDHDDWFTVTNGEGRVIATSPHLVPNLANSLGGYDANGLYFSKGQKQYSGFYGTFVVSKTKPKSITYNCR